MRYKKHFDKLKAIADLNRLKIIDILSCGEVCACTVLKHFKFTQPTLSHHMKVLIACGLVKSRKEGNWIYYSLEQNNCNVLQEFLSKIFSENDDCICNDLIENCSNSSIDEKN